MASGELLRRPTRVVAVATVECQSGSQLANELQLISGAGAI
jgi:hypothetical protein